MAKSRRTISIIAEVAILFLLGILVTGVITFFAERSLTEAGVMRQTEQRASQIADEVRMAVTEYPAYQWLLQYWHENADTLDIEYDVAYGTGTETEAKCRELTARHPGLQLEYLTEAQIGEMPAEDRKLYAEIAYSWLVTRVNEIKRSYHIDFLFCVVSKEPYDTQFFLFSGAEEDSVRGTNYEEVYPLGNFVTVTESQQTAMRNARRDSSHLADAGDYVDYYTYLCDLDDNAVFIGMTYGLSDLRAVVEVQTRTGTIFAVFGLVLLALLCLGLILFFVLRPLHGVQKNIRLYQVTKDNETVKRNLAAIRPRNEIGELSGDVSDLVTEIGDHLGRIQTITAEKERISTELDLATRIQANMLPSTFPAFPERSEFDIYASMDPARAVGGDFYDFFLVDDDHLCMVMADVSGKGIPAALFMMASKIVLKNNAMMGKTPSQILTDTNTAICANNREEMFVTVWLGILEISTGRLTAANAGHEYPALKHADGVFERYKDKHGFVIGGLEGMKYQEYELELEPGSKLFLYTDGVLEAIDAERVMFGMDRMLTALNAAPDAAPEQLLKSVRSAVDDFMKDAEPFDDLTMLCLEYKGQQLLHGEDRK